jgi:hypothetical protein
VTAVERRRADIAIILRLVAEARALFEADPSPVLKTSSTRTSANWMWETPTPLPWLEPGPGVVRVSRDGGRHIVTYFSNGRSNPLIRISEQNGLLEARRPAPSRQAVLDALDDVRLSIEMERDGARGDLPMLAAALLTRAGVSWVGANVRPPTRGITSITAALNGFGTTMQWIHPPIGRAGGLSPEAVRLLAEASAWATVWIGANTRRGTHVRTIQARIEKREVVDLLPPDPVALLRALADLPEDAMLVPAKRSRQRR